MGSGTGNRDEWGKMGKKTGRPRGRPSGAKNHHTLEREQRISEAASVIAELLPSAFQGDAHALLMAVYKDTTLPLQTRLDAAKAAIAYEKPRLAAVEHSGDGNKPVMFHDHYRSAAPPMTACRDGGQ